MGSSTEWMLGSTPPEAMVTAPSSLESLSGSNQALGWIGFRRRSIASIHFPSGSSLQIAWIQIQIGEKRSDPGPRSKLLGSLVWIGGGGSISGGRGGGGALLARACHGAARGACYICNTTLYAISAQGGGAGGTEKKTGRSQNYQIKKKGKTNSKMTKKMLFFPVLLAWPAPRTLAPIGPSVAGRGAA